MHMCTCVCVCVCACVRAYTLHVLGYMYLMLSLIIINDWLSGICKQQKWSRIEKEVGIWLAKWIKSVTNIYDI